MSEVIHLESKSNSDHVPIQAVATLTAPRAKAKVKQALKKGADTKALVKAMWGSNWP